MAGEQHDSVKTGKRAGKAKAVLAGLGLSLVFGMAAAPVAAAPGGQAANPLEDREFGPAVACLAEKRPCPSWPPLMRDRADLLRTLFSKWYGKEHGLLPYREDIFRLLLGGDLSLLERSKDFRGSPADAALQEWLEGAQAAGAPPDLSLFRALERAGFNLVAYIDRKPESLANIFTIPPGLEKGAGQEDRAIVRLRSGHLALARYLAGRGLDLGRLAAVTGKDGKPGLFYVAAATGNTGLLSFLEKKGFSGWDHIQESGANAADYSRAFGASTAEAWLKRKGVRSRMKEVAAAHGAAENWIPDFLDDRTLFPEDFAPGETDASFGMFPRLEMPKYRTGRKPLVAVAEYDEDDKEDRHLQKTMRVASGVSQRLLQDESAVAGFSANPQPQDGYLFSDPPHPSFLLQGLLARVPDRGDDLVFSRSMGATFLSNPWKHYQDYKVSGFRRRAARHFLALNPVVHVSSGNMHGRDCARPGGMARDANACFRLSLGVEASARSVSEGAAERDGKGRWRVASYSSGQPTFCVPLSYEQNGQLYRGTSFAAPAGAANEAALLRLHGRSPVFPAGVSHEDVILALSLTADREVIDPQTGDTLVYERNAAGLERSVRCGAGVIRPEKADALLREMVAATFNRLAKPTVLKTVQREIDEKAYRLSGPGLLTESPEYVYEIEIPETGIVTKPYLFLNFGHMDKGAAVLVSPRGTKSVPRLGLDGSFDDDSFWGERWEKGEKLVLTTTRPLVSADGKEGSAAVFRIVNTDSVLSYTAQRWRGMLSGGLYGRTDFSHRPR